MPKIRSEQLSAHGVEDGLALAVSSEKFVFVPGAKGSQTLAQILGFGTTTEGHNIELTNGDKIKGTDAQPDTNGSGGNIDIAAGLKDGAGSNGIITLDALNINFKINGIETAQIDSYGLILKNSESYIRANNLSIESNDIKIHSEGTTDIKSGNINLVSGDSGGINIISGSSSSSDAGVIWLVAGNANSGLGGPIHIKSGDSINNAGEITIAAGSSEKAVGGNVAITGGNGNSGGEVTIKAGTPSGNLQLFAGDKGGTVSIKSDDGNILISTGIDISAKGNISLKTDNNINLTASESIVLSSGGFVSISDCSLKNIGDAIDDTDGLNLRSLLGTGGSAQYATIKTTNAIAKTILTYSKLDVGNCSVTLLARVSGVKDDGSAALGYLIMGTFKGSGGSVAQVGATTVLASHKTTGTWDVTFNVSSPNIQVQVTGQSSTNISWKCTLSAVFIT